MFQLTWIMTPLFITFSSKENQPNQIFSTCKHLVNNKQTNKQKR